MAATTRKWSEVDDLRLTDLKLAGVTGAEIAVLLNRPLDGIKARVRRLGLSKLRPRVPKADGAVLPLIDAPKEVPHEVWEDRARRQAAPRSLTAAVCGDPPFGFSALEQRA